MKGQKVTEARDFVLYERARLRDDAADAVEVALRAADRAFAMADPEAKSGKSLRAARRSIREAQKHLLDANWALAEEDVDAE